MVEKLFPGPFPKNRNWAYLCINSLKCYHGTITRTEWLVMCVTLRWFIAKKAKIFEVMLNIFELSRVWENVVSWLVFAIKFFWITQPYFFAVIIKTKCQLLFLAFKTFNRYNPSPQTKKVFIYIAIAKCCWVMKLGELKSDQKYFAR